MGFPQYSPIPSARSKDTTSRPVTTKVRRRVWHGSRGRFGNGAQAALARRLEGTRLRGGDLHRGMGSIPVAPPQTTVTVGGNPDMASDQGTTDLPTVAGATEVGRCGVSCGRGSSTPCAFAIRRPVPLRRPPDQPEVSRLRLRHRRRTRGSGCVRSTAYGFRKHDSGRGLAYLEAVRMRHEPDGGRIPSADELAPVASRRPLWRSPPRRQAPGRPRSAGSPVRSPGRTRTQGLRGSPFEDPLSKDRFSPASSEHAGRPYRRISTHLDERNQQSRPGYLWQSARSRVESGAVTICSPTRLHVQWL
jgi:hypothetical protein